MTGLNGGRSELKLLSEKLIPRCYFHGMIGVINMQLHGFSDASECGAYSAVVFLCSDDTAGNTRVSIVTSKTMVAPIKKLTIPRLKLCGAYLLANLICHIKEMYQIPMCKVFVWTDSTIVLYWLSGNPWRFKTYVANRVIHIVDNIPPWVLESC